MFEQSLAWPLIAIIDEEVEDGEFEAIEALIKLTEEEGE